MCDLEYIENIENKLIASDEEESDTEIETNNIISGFVEPNIEDPNIKKHKELFESSLKEKVEKAGKTCGILNESEINHIKSTY